ncbi:MAG TPA: glycine cleavage system aminomethyltransferase GcvT [Candidatus Bathyarchaeia archaeon]|nr:glycine cleavage system aminomethyltransferase GcvT [Candidatus Bathyarchaeia archaeon]
MLKRTHLYDFHRQNAKMVSFADFDMPLWYKGIIPEHLAVRNNVGIFDVTHMGRSLISGPNAEKFLNYMTSNNVASLIPLSAQYSTMCNERGGIKDDFVISKLEQEKFLMVYNAANRENDYLWLINNAKEFDVEIQDISDSVALFAVQGPRTEGTLQKISNENLALIGRFKCSWTRLADVRAFVSRTGYTGEDGFEVFVWNSPLEKPDNAVKVWNAILDAGREFDIEPCGLGARDTLRLEAGMCLYGNDIDESTTPFEAAIGFVVKVEKGDFIGKDALMNQKAEGIKRKRVGISMLDPGIPRQNFEVFKDQLEVGSITSGTFSPLLTRGIAIAYVTSESANTGQHVKVKIRGRLAEGEIVKFPFYDSTRYGYGRKT